MDRAAHGHPRAPHRGGWRADLRSRRRGRARRACRRQGRRAVDRFDRACDLDAGHHLSGKRRHGAGGAITDVIKEVFRDTGYTAEQLDWFVPHQANKRIIDGSAHKLGIAPEKVVTTVDRHGNTSAASIPLALDVAVKDGRIKRGDLVLLEAMGGGFTWGAALVRW